MLAYAAPTKVLRLAVIASLSVVRFPFYVSMFCFEDYFL